MSRLSLNRPLRFLFYFILRYLLIELLLSADDL